MKLTIQTLTGSTFDIEVAKYATVKDVKVSFILHMDPERVGSIVILGHLLNFSKFKEQMSPTLSFGRSSQPLLMRNPGITPAHDPCS